MKNIGIYKFKNNITGESYIGQSIHLNDRLNQHRRNHLNKKHINYYCDFYKALREYGFDNFTYEIIENCQKEELNEKEKYWIKFYDSYYNGYNMTPGGDYNPSYCPEIVKKRTEKLLNNPEINAKLKSYGRALLTEEDVVQIRTYYKEGKTFAEVLPLYEYKVSRSAFQQCWRGKTWPHIMPEVYQERPVENTGGSSLNSSKVKELRQDYMNGLTKDELIKKYNLTKSNLNRIIRLDRWNKENAIPKGYINFISK